MANYKIQYHFFSYTAFRCGLTWWIWKPRIVAKWENPSGDWTYWKFDSNNNWGVKFFPESPGEFEVFYRYFGDAAERLMRWLEFRIVNATLINEQTG
jgi:hypothetical protein